MNTERKLKRLRELFSMLHDILLREGENNWISGINLIIQKIEFALNSEESEQEEAYRYTGRTYKKMLGGMNTFSDFHIWRDDFAARRKANEELAKLQDEIWTLLA